jgi:hypothetical protein
MHHHPYYGMNGDALERDASFEDTNRLYLDLFGEDCKHTGSFPLECSTGCGWVDSKQLTTVAKENEIVAV